MITIYAPAARAVPVRRKKKPGLMAGLCTLSYFSHAGFCAEIS